MALTKSAFQIVFTHNYPLYGGTYYNNILFKTDAIAYITIASIVIDRSIVINKIILVIIEFVNIIDGRAPNSSRVFGHY